MATTAKGKPTAKRDTNTLTVQAKPSDTDAAIARALLHPRVQAADTLNAQDKAVNDGDLKRAEAMLTIQAHTLDSIFNNLAQRAINAKYMENLDRYLRLALKAQSQCRATLETLAVIKNPPIVYARQANVTTGPQQVNNGMPIPSRAREIEIEQSKQSGGTHELLSNTRASALAGRIDPQMEAMGEIDRSKVRRG